ncbi:MAG: hypothetical protein VX317_02525, partial [Verrucomicrobiota bacterium]|nr:hypothetical protein [Verrucomicrobiota bacterium]
MKALTPAPHAGKRKNLTSLSALAASGLVLGGAIGAAGKDITFQPPPLKVREGFEVTLAAAPPLL